MNTGARNVDFGVDIYRKHILGYLEYCMKYICKFTVTDIATV
jgi:hypothetical protein